MKGLEAISKATQDINFRDRTTWISLYYSIEKDTAYTNEGAGRFFITYLINPQTAEDVKEAIDIWKRS